MTTPEGREQATCGAFGCDERPVVHGIRGDEWVPGDYCAEHGANVEPVPSTASGQPPNR